MPRDFHYNMSIQWTGNASEGTKDVKTYERGFIARCEGKPELLGSADHHFRGDAQRWNPEELLVAALSSCHMLSYLYLCAVKGIIITAYDDNPTATMRLDDTGKGYFTEVILNPIMTLAHPDQADDAIKLHEEAHRQCFIANSVNFPVNAVPKAVGANA